MTSEHWKDEPEKQDFPAARSYLSLLVDPGEAKRTAKELGDEPDAARYKAKDILRAARLPLLPFDDPEVAKDLAKVKAGTKLSPVLLVRGDPLWVADGYHRICASYHLDEDAEIPCRIVARPRVNTGHKRTRKALP
ncbi:MAG: hypothetical protein M0Z40_03840 [Actinomycetota bacterium]|jgi:hypothetical protein|nr:hypothetical protein [Actinomycetota bacterium]MDA8074357.1 hypothetical protein [Actinomycetota bacterium]